MIEDSPSSFIELDINPLLLLAEGRGVVAADALISLNAEATNHANQVIQSVRENPNE
jgi:succinyl-CoA synthetase beta subunit